MADKPVAFIVGGSRGIGRGMAERLSREGYDLALVARTSHCLNEAANECRKNGARVLTFSFDVTNSSVLQQSVEHTVNTYGSIDVLVYAAGFFCFAPMEKIPVEGLFLLVFVILKMGTLI